MRGRYNPYRTRDRRSDDPGRQDDMNDVQPSNTTRFVLLAVRHDATYWTPHTIAKAIVQRELLDSPSDEELATFRDNVLRGLVGKAAEKFWASDAVTPQKAAAIRSACKALHELTIDVLHEAAGELRSGAAT